MKLKLYASLVQHINHKKTIKYAHTFLFLLINYIRPKKKIITVSCFKGKKIRVGRSEKHFISSFFNFIFIKIQKQISKP
jgi:hypothetical protein